MLLVKYNVRDTHTAYASAIILIIADAYVLFLL